MDERVKIELVKGHGMGEGLYINDTRVAGTKPMPGGSVVKSWEVSKDELVRLLRELTVDDIEKK